MTGVPLILQIQQAAIDSSASLGDALRKAKLACAKLGLAEFGSFVDLEINGYHDVEIDDFPPYRKIVGRPQSFNPHHGWLDIGFQSQELFNTLATIPCASSVPILEAQISESDADGCFEYHYAIEQQNIIRRAIGFNWQLRNRIEISAMRAVLETVRNILIDWTIKLEQQGVLGEGLMFSADDKKASAVATEGVVNHFHMNNVGAFVQNATHSVVQGGVDSTLNMGDVSSLIDQIAGQKDNLPAESWKEIEPKLAEIREELAGEKSPTKIKGALNYVKDVCTKIGTSVAATGIVHLITALAS